MPALEARRMSAKPYGGAAWVVGFGALGCLVFAGNPQVEHFWCQATHSEPHFPILDSHTKPSPPPPTHRNQKTASKTNESGWAPNSCCTLLVARGFAGPAQHSHSSSRKAAVVSVIIVVVVDTAAAAEAARVARARAAVAVAVAAISSRQWSESQTQSKWMQ